MNEKDLEALLTTDVHRVMADDYGRRFVWELLGWFRLNETVCTLLPGFDMAQSILHNSGRQEAGRRLVGMIMKVCPELYHRMVMEQATGRKLEEIANG